MTKRRSTETPHRFASQEGLSIYRHFNAHNRTQIHRTLNYQLILRTLLSLWNIQIKSKKMQEQSEYEMERLKRIEENRRVLESMGIGNMSAEFKKEQPIKPPKRSHKKSLTTEDALNIPLETRKSSRLSGTPQSFLKTLSDEEFEDKERAIKKNRNEHGQRISGGRVYDTVNGTSCHQCRQKTMDPKVKCSNESTFINEKGFSVTTKCNVYFDERCLFGRYGQTLAEALATENWKCPKCTGKCNCSICRRKLGLNATGQMKHKATGKGYNSIQHLLSDQEMKLKKKRETLEKNKERLSNILVNYSPSSQNIYTSPNILPSMFPRLENTCPSTLSPVKKAVSPTIVSTPRDIKKPLSVDQLLNNVETPQQIPKSPQEIPKSQVTPQTNHSGPSPQNTLHHLIATSSGDIDDVATMTRSTPSQQLEPKNGIAKGVEEDPPVALIANILQGFRN